MDRIKKDIIKIVEGFKDEIINLSKEIHKNPEIGFKEYKSRLL